MIFTHNGIRCAYQGGIISHRGPFSLFENGALLTVNDRRFKIIETKMSPYVEKVFNTIVEEEV